MRIGIGYDIHQLVAGRPLIIGGVHIPYEKGLLGHSDGDVLIHAVADAIIGALGMGDIGQYYPDTDPKNAGLSGLVILDEMRNLVGKKKFQVENLDSVIIAQAPKISPYRDEMHSVLAKHLQTDVSRINIKAKTAEKLDALGRGEGIAAHVVVLLNPKSF